MRPSNRKTTAAVLRQILGKTDWEMADILKRSVHTVRSIESGRLKLSQEHAKRLWHETLISPSWLMANDPNAPAVAESGEPYTREIYERAQAQKIPHDQPHPIFRNTDKLGFCARLIAILENASTRKDYYMALYKAHTALDSLQREFGIDEKVYQHSGPHSVNTSMAVEALKRVLTHDKDL